jgi:hypothetical protein
MAALLFGGGYWYYTALAICNVPISYRIGSIDERFILTMEEAQNALSGAESLWEDGTDRNLFTQDPQGDLVVHFVYDERQRRADEEELFRATLDQKEGMSDSVRSEYESLLAQYETLRNSFTNTTNAYEKKLATYNAEVAEWNTKGGAPKDVFVRLEKNQETLKKEEVRLNATALQLNTVVKKMNALSDRGNSLIQDYNSLANEYNDRFSEGGEFTQGEYENKVINIYEFDSKDELTLVLAHEFGHALALDHAGDETAVMYHTMGKQSLVEGLTLPDRVLFEQQCGTEDSIPNAIRLLLEALKKALFAK